MEDNPVVLNGHRRWASFRLSVVGPLLAAPPPKGTLQARLNELADTEWKHPITGESIRFKAPTIEQWYYLAKNEKDPIDALARKVRDDRGAFRVISAKLRSVILALHRDHRSWTHQLHYDNVKVLVEKHPTLGEMPSYSSFRRFRKSLGLIKEKKARHSERPGAQKARARLEAREVRGFESDYVMGLWHSDFHEGSLRILRPDGSWVKPQLLAFLDDRSRLICHAQWYLTENAENFVHGLMQAILKRGLPRALMTDNGSGMTAGDTVQGLDRLSIPHETTLPESPYQNGKQEVFWAQVEGRLVAMLESKENLTLAELNEATQAWVEMEYQHQINSETAQSPIDRFLAGPTVGRPSPGMEDLRLAFGTNASRRVRHSDATITLEGVRFEIPSRYRHHEQVVLRYTAWDLSLVHIVDPRTDKPICRIYPRDPSQNADGVRRSLEPAPIIPSLEEVTGQPMAGMAPLLERLVEEYRKPGLPPAYFPKDDVQDAKDPGVNSQEVEE